MGGRDCATDGEPGPDLSSYPDTMDPTEPAWVMVDPVSIRHVVWVLEHQPVSDGARDLAVALLKLLYIEGINEKHLDEPEHVTGNVLYRLLDGDGRVLYVGVSRNFAGRMRVHRRNWGSLFSDVLTEVYPTVKEMFEAEALAIRNESPPLNRAGIE